jgi:hypothetical protein
MDTRRNEGLERNAFEREVSFRWDNCERLAVDYKSLVGAIRCPPLLSQQHSPASSVPGPSSSKQSGELAALASETELAKGQLEINKEEAKAGPFRGGWRPFIGWSAGLGLFYNFVARPFLQFILEYNQIPGELPALDLSELMPLVLGMLGLGGLRSWEKTKGLS